MTHPFYLWDGFSSGFFGLGVVGLTLVTLLAIAFVALKGYALWHAVKRDEKGWFVAILVLNTFGILELVYLYFVVKKWQKSGHAHHREHTHHTSS